MKAYVSGTTLMMNGGKITDHNTINDFDKKEQKAKREFSIGKSIPIEWGEKQKIHILDTGILWFLVNEEKQ